MTPTFIAIAKSEHLASYRRMLDWYASPVLAECEAIVQKEFDEVSAWSDERWCRYAENLPWLFKLKYCTRQVASVVVDSFEFLASKRGGEEL